MAFGAKSSERVVKSQQELDAFQECAAIEGRLPEIAVISQQELNSILDCAAHAKASKNITINGYTLPLRDIHELLLGNRIITTEVLAQVRAAVSALGNE